MKKLHKIMFLSMSHLDGIQAGTFSGHPNIANGKSHEENQVSSTSGSGRERYNTEKIEKHTERERKSNIKCVLQYFRYYSKCNFNTWKVIQKKVEYSLL